MASLNYYAFRRLATRSRSRTTFILLGLILFSISVLVLGSCCFRKQIPSAWKSRSVEAGLFRVMEFMERESEVDSVVRDAFVDRIWRSVKMDLVRELVSDADLNQLNKTIEFVRENADLLEYRFGQKQSGGNSKISKKRRVEKNHRYHSSDHNYPSYKTRRGNATNLGREKVDLAKFLSKPIINPFEFSYNYDQSSACVVFKPDILIAVPSAPENFERRHKVRMSRRAKFAKVRENRAMLLFFTGYPDPSSGESSRMIQDTIDQEQIRNGDIVQATFIDVYKNITQKAALLLDWSTKYCSKAKFLIRTDDDVTVNITEIISAMEEKSVKFEHFIIGKMRNSERPERNIHSKYHKYFVSFEEWPYEKLPPFLLGGAMGYPIRTASLLLESMRRVVLFWLDDVFVTGICARQVGIPIFDSPQFHFGHP